MTSSNEKKNITGDQADDLIAELARIVADDAQQTNVADSINERAEASLSAPVVEQPNDNVSAFAASDTSRQPSADPIDNVFAGGFELPPAAQPTTPEPIAEVPAQTQSQTAPAPQTSVAAPSTELTAGDATPFEFDFSESIKSGPSTDLQSERVEPLFSPSIGSANESQTAFTEEPVVQSETVPGPAELDGIASLIEEVENQNASAEEPKFDPLPVPTAVDEEIHPTTAAEYEIGAETHEELPQTDVPADSFAEPPSQDAAQFEREDVVQDALSEIENLIADTKPVEPSQPTQKAPADAAEAAIMAALGAARSASGQSGSVVSAARASNQTAPREPIASSETPSSRDRVELPPAAEAKSDFAEQPLDKEKKRGAMAPVIGVSVAVLLLALVGGGAYWMFFGQGGDTEVPVVAAQNTEVKLTPEPTESTEPESSVFNALEGNSENPTDEQIVSRDDTASGDTATAPRVITPSSTSNGLTNRKVKTVTVLADGTIVTGEEASAGAEQLPQEVRPNVPEVTTAETEATITDEITNVLNSIVEDTTAPVTEAVENVATDIASLTDALTNPTTETAEQPAATVAAESEAAPTPPSRPAGLGTDQPLASAVLATPQASTSSSSTTEQPISLLPSASSNSATNNSANSATSSGVNAPFYVQLSSQRSQEAAQATATTLSRQYSSVLGNSTLDINRVNLGDRGIYYRVRVPASSLADANALCSNLKASGGDCFVRSN